MKFLPIVLLIFSSTLSAFAQMPRYIEVVSEVQKVVSADNLTMLLILDEESTRGALSEEETEEEKNNSLKKKMQSVQERIKLLHLDLAKELNLKAEMIEQYNGLPEKNNLGGYNNAMRFAIKIPINEKEGLEKKIIAMKKYPTAGSRIAEAEVSEKNIAEYEKTMLNEAVVKANSKAKAIAQAQNLSLGNIISIEEMTSTDVMGMAEMSKPFMGFYRQLIQMVASTEGTDKVSMLVKIKVKFELK